MSLKTISPFTIDSHQDDKKDLIYDDNLVTEQRLLNNPSNILLINTHSTTKHLPFGFNNKIKKNKIDMDISSITEESQESFQSNNINSVKERNFIISENSNKLKLKKVDNLKSEDKEDQPKYTKLNVNKTFHRSNTQSIDTHLSKVRKSQSNDYNEIQNENEKKKKQRINQLWTRLKLLTRGLVSFKKLSNSIRLYGNSQEIFDANHPEVFEQNLKKIEKANEMNANVIKHQIGKYNKIVNYIINPIKPDSLFLFWWNIYLCLLMLYTLVITPYYLSFLDMEDNGFFLVFIENLIDFSFLTDVIVNFNLSFYRIDNSNQENILIDNRIEIIKHYLSSWFIFDIISSLPYSLIINDSIRITSTYFKFTKIPRIYRLIKMFRVAKLFNFFHKIKFFKPTNSILNINFGLSKLLSFLITTIIFSHNFACIWYLFPKIFNENYNWIIYKDLQDEDNFTLYLYSLYYSFTTLFTLGFGDIYSINDTEKILSILWMTFGIGFFSFTIGTLSSVLADMDSRENKLKYKLSILNDFAKDTNLSQIIKEKIKNVLIYNSEKQTFSWIEKQSMFNDLPSNLKVDIARAMKSGYLKNISFFTSRDDSFVAMMIPFLLPWNIQEKEKVYMVNDHPNQMYFIIKGRVFFVNEDFIPFKTMIVGSYFGEIEIVFKIKRSNTTIAAETSDLLTLSKQYYENIIVKEYAEIHDELMYIARIRSDKNREAELYLNKTLQNNKDKFGKTIFIHEDSRKSSKNLLFDELEEMRKYKKEIKLNLMNRSFSYFEKRYIINYNEYLYQEPNSFRHTSNLISNSHIFKDIHKESIDCKSEMNDLNEEKYKSKEDSPYKTKLDFYNKLITSTKIGSDKRRPSYLINKIINKKISGIKHINDNDVADNLVDEVVKEESVESDDDSIKTESKRSSTQNLVKDEKKRKSTYLKENSFQSNSKLKTFQKKSTENLNRQGNEESNEIRKGRRNIKGKTTRIKNLVQRKFSETEENIEKWKLDSRKNNLSTLCNKIDEYKEFQLKSINLLSSLVEEINSKII